MKNKKSSPDDTTSGVKTEREYSNSGTDKERRSLVGPTTRRRFLTRVGLGATLLALGGQVYAFFRSLVPNVLYEDPNDSKSARRISSVRALGSLKTRDSSSFDSGIHSTRSRLPARIWVARSRCSG